MNLKVIVALSTVIFFIAVVAVLRWKSLQYEQRLPG